MEDMKLDISINSDLSQVQLVGRTVRCLCEDLVLTRAAVSQVELAVVESINNSIEHAYSMEGGFRIDVVFECNRDMLTVLIKDYGKPMAAKTAEMFNNDVIKMPEFSADTDSLPESGWGVQLVKSLCDSISYSRDNTCNKLMLRFDLERAAA